MKKKNVKKMMMTIIMLLLSSTMIAENDVVKKDENWKNENERTITSVPKLSIDDSFLYIYSKQQLDNARLCIQDINGNIIYSIVTSIPACHTYSIPVSGLNNGEYTFMLTMNDGNKYILADVLIDN